MKEDLRVSLVSSPFAQTVSPKTIFFLLLFPRMIFVDFFQNLEENKTGGTKAVLWLGVKSEQRIRKSNGSIPAWKNTRGKIEVDFTLYFPLFLRRGLFCWASEKCWQGAENSHFLSANENHSPSGNHLALPHSLKTYYDTFRMSELLEMQSKMHFKYNTLHKHMLITVYNNRGYWSYVWCQSHVFKDVRFTLQKFSCKFLSLFLFYSLFLLRNIYTYIFIEYFRNHFYFL